MVYIPSCIANSSIVYVFFNIVHFFRDFNDANKIFPIFFVVLKFALPHKNEMDEGPDNSIIHHKVIVIQSCVKKFPIWRCHNTNPFRIYFPIFKQIDIMVLHRETDIQTFWSFHHMWNSNSQFTCIHGIWTKIIFMLSIICCHGIQLLTFLRFRFCALVCKINFRWRSVWWVTIGKEQSK